MSNNQKLDIQSLKNVENTLLFPLYSRSLDCKSSNPILNDKKSLEILNRIDLDFTVFDDYLDNFAILGHTLRSKYFDQKAKHFLEKFPTGIIVSLGSGLDTRFYRIDNGKVTFIDLDLPNVIAIRKRVLDENQRNFFISSSILDFTWFDQVKSVYRNTSQPLLILAEAILMYIPKEDIVNLLRNIVINFPNCELVFDIYSNFMIKQVKQQKGLIAFQSEFKWGVKNAKEIEKLIPDLKVISEWCFFDSPKTHTGRFKILIFIPFIKNMSRIAHYKTIKKE